MTTRNFIKQTTLSYGVLAIVMVMGYAMRIIFAKNLSTYDYGLFYSILGLFGFLSIFRSLGTNTSLIHFLPKYIKDKNNSKIKSLLLSVFFFQFCLGLTISTLLFIFSKTIATTYLHLPEAAGLIRLQAITYLIIGFVEFIKSVFSGYQKPAFSMLYDALRNTFIVGFSWLALRYGLFNVKNLIIIWLISYVLFALIYFILFLFQHKELIPLKFKKYDSIIKEVKKYSIPLMWGIAATLILAKTDVILLTLFKGLEQVAFYEVAFPIASLIATIGGPIALILLPLVSKYYFEKNHQQIKTILQLIYNSGIFLILPLAFLLMKYSEFFILLMFSKEYLIVIPALRIFIIGMIFSLFNLINLSILSGVGEIKKKTKILYLGAIFNVILDIILIPILGYLGAIIVTSLSYLLMTIASLAVCYKEIPGFKINWHSFAKIGVNLTIFMGTLYILDIFIPSKSLIKYGISIIISGIVYLGLGIFVMKIVNYKEGLKLMKKTFKLKKNE